MNRLYLWMTTLVLVFGLPALAWANGATGSQHGPGAMWHGGWHGGWSGMWFGPLMMILFVAIAAVVVVLIVRWLGGWGQGERRHVSGKAPLDLLEERFARGEIEAEEFQERRRILNE